MTSDPAPVPLLPDDGDSFLDGSIKPGTYLAEKRAQEREKALTEIEETRRSDRPSAITAAAILVVVLANLAVVLGAIVSQHLEVALAGFVVAALGLLVAIRELMSIRRTR